MYCTLGFSIPQWGGVGGKGSLSTPLAPPQSQIYSGRGKATLEIYIVAMQKVGSATFKMDAVTSSNQIYCALGATDYMLICPKLIPGPVVYV